MLNGLTCQKRRRVIRKEQDGTQRELYRCAHGAAVTYRQEIDEDVCENCTLRQVLLSRRPCKTKPPTKPIYQQPAYGDEGEIKYPVVNAQPPECPEGYAKQEEDPWTFESKWFPCPYRVFNNDLQPTGELQVNAYCALTQKRLTFEECQQCKGDLIEVNASLEPVEIAHPGLSEKVKNYWKAIKKWVAAGRPTRDTKEVQRIHEKFCSRCDWYDKETRTCNECGCKVRKAGPALLNKIKMATENCPRNFW